MKKLRVAAMCAWLLALVPITGTFGQESTSVTLDGYGWWNKTQALPVEGDPTGLGLTTVPTVPAPATVPEDGMYVSNDASGPAAFAAVRYRGAVGGTLTVRLAEGAALTGTEELSACQVQGGFEPAQNGRWSAAPAYDDAGCVEAVVAEDGSTISFDAPGAWASALGDLSIAIVPTPGSTTPFSLALAKPADGDLVAASAPSSSSYSPPATFSSGSGSGSFSAPSGSGSFSAPSAPSVATPTTVAGDQSAAPAVPVATTPAAATAVEESKAAQVVAIALLVAIGAALWWLSTRPQRAPKLLGSIGSGAVPAVNPLVTASRPRGVGRFARPRSAPPTAI